MICFEPTGGLCNRLRAISSMIELNNDYNLSSNIIISWKKNKELNCSFYELFKPLESIPLKDIKQMDQISHFYQRITSKLYLDDKSVKNLRQGLLLPRNAFNGIKENDKVYIATGHQFYTKLNFGIYKPLDSVLDKVNKIYNFSNGKIIGVHIRRSDNINAIQTSSSQGFIKQMKNEIDNNPNVKFFLSTDSLDEEKLLCKEFEGRVITQGKKVLNRNSSEGIICALIDLLCLSKTDKIIGSYYSSFSEVAAQWGQIPISIVKNN
ncbi:hypothetical protein [Clostridium drakei]|uniref:Glycosyl transferase n=1 Tax=Clostridium drakei TaxID=332101 RepID=A0A2U8DUG0_9CLOT|nr:hypothetical protein [Clostridium drakei]AWI06383.1 hypothetical protein B9W14_18390 [Clostridium drakei]